MLRRGTKPRGLQKFSATLVDVVRQVAERKGRRVCLEEQLPGLIITPSIFPVSEGSGKGFVLWACEKYMVSGMLGLRSAGLAEGGFVWMEAPPVFARRGVICQGASHTANGRYIIARQSHEEGFARLVSNVGFEFPTSPFDWEPAAAFVRLGRGKGTPVGRHVPFELADEVRPQDPEGSGRA